MKDGEFASSKLISGELVSTFRLVGRQGRSVGHKAIARMHEDLSNSGPSFQVLTGQPEAGRPAFRRLPCSGKIPPCVKMQQINTFKRICTRNSSQGKRIMTWTLNGKGRTECASQIPNSPPFHQSDLCKNDTYANKQNVNVHGRGCQHSNVQQASNHSTLECSHARNPGHHMANARDSLAAESVSVLARSLPLASTIRIQARFPNDTKSVGSAIGSVVSTHLLSSG
jgi:hypothetical protein